MLFVRHYDKEVLKMKHGKNPTASQKKFLASWGLNSREWLVSKDAPDRMVVVHRHTDTVRTIEK